jgi:hypothetical protein
VAILRQRRNREALSLDREDMVVAVVVRKWGGVGGRGEGRGGEGRGEAMWGLPNDMPPCCLPLPGSNGKVWKITDDDESLMTLFQSMDYCSASWRFYQQKWDCLRNKLDPAEKFTVVAKLHGL